MVIRVVKAGGILGIGLILTLVLFPWLDHLRDTTYHNVTPVAHESAVAGDNSDVLLSTDNWLAQTFVVADAYRMTETRVRLWRESAAGTVSVSIYGTSAGAPSGAALASGTVATGAISLVQPGDWETVEFDDPLDVAVGTYAIVLHYTGTGPVYWRAVQDGSGLLVSTDGGLTWEAYQTGGGEGGEEPCEVIPDYEGPYLIWIECSAGGGECDPLGEQYCDLGEDIEITISPAEEYWVYRVYLDDHEVNGIGYWWWGSLTRGEGAELLLTLTNVDRHHDVYVAFTDYPPDWGPFGYQGHYE